MVLADGAPRSVVEDLHPALASCIAIHQTHQRVGNCVGCIVVYVCHGGRGISISESSTKDGLH